MTDVAILGRGHLGVVALETCLNLRWDVRRVVTTALEPAWDRCLSSYASRVHPEVSLDTSGDWRTLIDLDVDLILSVMYDRIIGRDLIEGPARVLNLHLGKLPEYRGMRPINWSLKNGESVAGVTLHEVDEGIDTGPIVAQTTFSIFPDVDEVRDVYGRAVRAGEAILRDTLPIIDKIKAVPQDDSLAGYYSAADAVRLGDRADWERVGAG
jgi:methionyl-tRNA formyltransferase